MGELKKKFEMNTETETKFIKGLHFDGRKDRTLKKEKKGSRFHRRDETKEHLEESKNGTKQEFKNNKGKFWNRVKTTRGRKKVEISAFRNKDENIVSVRYSVLEIWRKYYGEKFSGGIKREEEYHEKKEEKQDMDLIMETELEEAIRIIETGIAAESDNKRPEMIK
ncbi:hypothetical protein HHI36_019822 [Cryptolaemus montrouzieri]|uniref:Uncharacterized protein n=1 Tax=Cryptolaemus montrouzieri TaxID=559131 RepID=A0ABD2N989_9CUCU